MGRSTTHTGPAADTLEGTSWCLGVGGPCSIPPPATPTAPLLCLTYIVLSPCSPQDTRGALAKLTGYVRTEREQHKVLTVLATRYANRQGGYTRVLRCGIRRHDAAPMAFIE
jgi:hypothetical protein